ncbi:MAG: TonB-dependent receptor plug domain-containing protein [Gemmatimonadetes bacterium]|nr:TonB-dependent receptor plug domain-containing protein [Gemmatimonadota bacterium]
MFLPTVLHSGRRRSRVHCATLIALATVLTPSFASAQYPGELSGRVTDAITGAPVDNALVEVVGTSLTALSDGRGQFQLRGLEPGRHPVRFTRMGYESQVREIEVRNGETTWLVVRLGARPIELEEVRAAPSAAQAAETAPGVIAIDRAEIEGSGEHTAAGLLEGRAGLVVQRRGPVGRQTVSIRGSSADQVLVLLDGAPFGDALTGAADLSTVPTSQIESITVLKGSQSARFGPGAEAGVVLIETRRDAAPLAARLETGSLGSWSASAETSGGDPRFAWSAGGYARTLDGEFEYQRPDGLGGGSDTRDNNDLSEANLFAAATGHAAGGDLRIRAGFTRLNRGLPGPSYQPTRDAREELTRWNGQAGWERLIGGSRLSASLHGVFQRAHFSDPEPPLGTPYDSRTDALSLGGRFVVETSPSDRVRSASVGLELRGGRYKSDAFDESTPGGRVDLGLFAGAAFAATPDGSPQLRAALRLDRDGLEDLWRLTHELTLTASAGFATFHLRHASSYSPPTFGDQFFREGVLVKPNPELRAERVPSELSLSAALEGLIGSTRGRLAVDAYIADVKDMIIWAPDFRFVWSPRNFDVKRRGLDVEGSIELAPQGLTVRAAYNYARVTYDRPEDDTVQVMYRPRYSGSIGARWLTARWEIGADARYIGERYPVPAPLNALDPYWTVDLRLRRSFDAGSWQITPTLAVDRLFDNDDSLIFGYPEPGRVVRFELAARPRTPTRKE